MKVQVINSNNYKQTKPTFSAKLSISSLAKGFYLSRKEINQIETAFEHNTKQIPGLLKVSDHYWFNSYSTHYRFMYTNEDHEDSLDIYSNELAKTPDEFLQTFQSVLNIFQNREPKVKKIKELIRELSEDSKEPLKRNLPEANISFEI